MTTGKCSPCPLCKSQYSFVQLRDEVNTSRIYVNDTAIENVIRQRNGKEEGYRTHKGVNSLKKTS